MDFSVAGSDEWGSSPAEEAFLTNYFSADLRDKKSSKKMKGVVKGSAPIHEKIMKKKKRKKVMDVDSQDSISKKNIKSLNKSEKKNLLSNKFDNNNTPTNTETMDPLNKLDEHKEYLENVTQTKKLNRKLKKQQKKNKNNIECIKEKCVSESAHNFEETSMKHKRRKLLSKVKNEKYESSDNDLTTLSLEKTGTDDNELKNEIIDSEEYKAIQKLIEKVTPAELMSGVENSSFSDNDFNSELSDSDDITAEAFESSADESDELVVTHKPKIQLNSNEKIYEAHTSLNSDSQTKQDNSLTKLKKTNSNTKAQEKLHAARFRFLNQRLYTETGDEAFKYFSQNKEDFDDYHLGFTLQVSKWPFNPVDRIIADIKKMKESHVIADMGCGEAKIAQTLKKKVFSFDIIAMNEYVTACNISKVPLQKESVDVVVFCLSLMGTNLKDYLCEAFRILKHGGTLKIAEVESRFEDIDLFIKKLCRIGFVLKTKNTNEKMFVFMDFTKEKDKFKRSKVEDIMLKPCLYKKR